MEIKTLKNTTINWNKIPTEKSNGITGFVNSKTVEFPTFKIRQLTFSENYEADHWCEKGHIIFVVKGELIIEQKNEPSIRVTANNSVILGDNTSSHKAKTEIETSVFIID